MGVVTNEKRHRIGKPTAVPSVFALGAILVLMVNTK
jgi:hypothetical protein